MYTAPTRPLKTTEAYLWEALVPRTSNFDRVGALVRYLTIVAPRWMARLQRRLEQPDELPLRTSNVTPFAFGKGSSCVSLEGTPRILKIFRASLGQDVRSLVAMARQLEDDYDTLRRWYAEVPDLFPHTVHVVLRSPLRGVPAAARIQERVWGPSRDLLLDFRDDDLVDLLRSSPSFGGSFRAFAAATRRAWDDDGRFLDMIGPDNVIVVQPTVEPQLRVIDFGIMDVEEKRLKVPRIFRQAAGIVKRLEGIAARIT